MVHFAEAMTLRAYLTGVASTLFLQALIAAIWLWRRRRTQAAQTAPTATSGPLPAATEARSLHGRGLTRSSGSSSSAVLSPRMPEPQQEQPQQELQGRGTGATESEHMHTAVPQEIQPQPGEALQTPLPRSHSSERAGVLPTDTGGSDSRPLPSETLQCPLCRRPMAERRAHTGGKFFGCTNFPECRGTRSFSDPHRASPVREIRRRQREAAAQQGMSGE